MERFEILSPGAKIKNIRKKLGLKQYEITGGEITRNLISIIENDKAALTKAVAKVVASNINAVCEEKDIDFHVTYQYLMENEKEQAVKIVDKYLERLSVDNLSELEMFEKFVSIYDIGDRKAIAYEKIGELYFAINDFYQAYTYLIKAYEFLNKSLINEQLINLVILIVKCNIEFKRYEEALKLVSSINTEETSLNINDSYIICREKINLFIILGKFEMALEEIELMEERYLVIEEEVPNELLRYKANCLKEIKHYSDSLEIQNKILESINHNTFEALVINSDIMQIYMLLRDNRNIRKKLNECEEILLNPEIIYKEKFSLEYFYIMASACKFIGENDLAKSYYKHCLNAAKRNKNIEMILKSLDKLFDFYAIENNIEEIDSLKNEMIEIISMRPEVRGENIVFKILSFYNDVDDKDTLKGMISFILE